MSLATIKTSVFDHLESAGLSEPIYFDNVDLPDGTPPTTNHLKPYVLPSTTNTLGLNTLSQEIGIIQVNVFVVKGSGDIIGATIGQLILDAFPRNLELDGLRIDRVGYISPAFDDDGGWRITPVSIPYQNLC